MNLRHSFCAFTIATALAAVACSGSSKPDGSGGSGGGGTGGEPPSESARPICSGQTGGGPVPDARGDSAGAVSLDGRTMVVFGGDEALVLCGDAPSHSHVGDTWVLDTACGTWTNYPADPAGRNAPPPRSRHAMALDPKRNRALLFGGRSRTGTTGPFTLFSDVWAFDFNLQAWSLIPTKGTRPSRRSGMAVAVLADQLVMFGGDGSSSDTALQPLGDTWVLDLATSTWSTIQTDTPPDARVFHAFAADEADSLVYMFGGATDLTGPLLKDVWNLDVGNQIWTKVDAEPPVDGRARMGASVFPRDSGNPAKLLVFGGHDDGLLGNRNDIAGLNLGNPSAGFAPVVAGDKLSRPPTSACVYTPDFTTLAPDSPERRSAFAFAPRASGKAFVVFGGYSDCGMLSDSYWYDAVAKTWTPIRTTLPGLTCPRTGNKSCVGLCQG